MSHMEKNKKIKTNVGEYKTPLKSTKLQEPVVTFTTGKVSYAVKDFDYREFKKIAGKVPFTIKEWSDILHISERTLQRYASANSSFPFSVTDRVLQINKVIKRGTEVFGNLDKFIAWIRSYPPALEGTISLQSLRSIEGMQHVLTQLGRIEHGILA